MNKNISKNKINLSVIIPTFNQEKKIIRAVTSIQNQKINNIEIIIIDDGSTDNTINEVKKLQKKNKNIYYYKIKNSGPANARNIGINKSNGKYILFVDSDDYLVKSKFHTLLNIIIKKKYDLVIGDFLILTSNIMKNSKNNNFFNSSHEFNNRKLFNYLKKFLNRPNMFPLFSYSWGRIFDSKIIKKNNILFNTSLRTFEDVDFNFKYLNFCEKIYFINKKIYVHEISNLHNSATMNISNHLDKFFGFTTALKTLEKYLSNNYKEDLKPKLAHAFISLSIVQLIRMAIKANKFNHNKIYIFFKNYIQCSDFQDNFTYYKPQVGDSKVIYFLIKYRLYKLAFYFCKYKGRFRYL